MEMGRSAVRDLARRMVVTERARLESMKRAIRGLGIGSRAIGGNAGAVEPTRQTFDYIPDPAVNGAHPPDVLPPPAEDSPLDHLVDHPDSHATEPAIDDTPLLDIAAETPEQLDGTVASGAPLDTVSRD